jgi:hypothetical protein
MLRRNAMAPCHRSLAVAVVGWLLIGLPATSLHGEWTSDASWANTELAQRRTISSDDDAADAAGVDPEIIGAFFPRRAELSAMRKRGFVLTGLEPDYPQEVRCPVADSLFAVDTRGDGSRRSRMFFHGHHGGIDIPVPEGTPVIAAAAGVVIYKGDGGSIGGIGLVLQHSPDDTGLRPWVYTEYKHLKEIPPIAIGARVRMGEPIALSGKTGTEGPHYGPAGHAHLHWTAFASPRDTFEMRRVLILSDGQWVDPLALFRGAPLESQRLADLPKGQKRVGISFISATGTIVPQGAKIVWPLHCAPL